MKRIEHLAMIAHDMGLIFEFLGLASLVPFFVLVIFREWDMVVPMATAPLTFILFGFGISHIPYKDLEPSFSATLVAVALSWLAIAFIGALPFVFGLHMSYTDSVFEAMSGLDRDRLYHDHLSRSGPENPPFLAVLHAVDRRDWHHRVRDIPAPEDPGVALPALPC